MDIHTRDDVSPIRSWTHPLTHAMSRAGGAVKRGIRPICLPALLLLASVVVHAATFTMPAGSNYFNGHLFSTFTGANGAAVTTGQASSLHTFTVSQVGSALGTGTLSQFASGLLPAGSGFPATTPRMAEMGVLNGLGLGGRIRYTFGQALPLGTHVYLQDVDQGETATLQFYTCAGTLINPSGFDYLVAATSAAPTAAFSTTAVTLTNSTGATNQAEPLVAVIIRNATVCRVEYTGTFAGGTFETYFSLPPVNPGITKSLATPNPVLPGGPVSWTLTATNNAVASGITGLSNPTPAYGVTLSDTVNTSVIGLTAVVTNAGGTTGGSCTIGAGNAVTCSGFSPLASGQSIVVTLSGTLASPYSNPTLPNTATVTNSVSTDVVAGNNSATSTTPVTLPPNFGTCDARMFMDQVPTSTSTLFNVNYTTAPFTLTSLGSSTSTTGRNGVGYNLLDNYIYGIRWPTSASVVELIRVGSNGAGQNLGVIAGLPNSTYNNGVISPTGIYYLKTGFSDTTLYRVNLAVTPYTATPITLSQPVQSFDFAWHNGRLYGVDITTSPSQLVSIDPATGAVTTIGSSFPLTNALAMWGYNNMILGSTGGAIYALDPEAGSATLLSNISPSANNGDGANCPGANIQFNADLSVTKTNTPASGASDLPSDSYTLGETRTYSIVVTNNSSSFGAQNVTVSDPVPAGIDPATVSWTCTNTSGSSRCGAASGTGALNDTGLDLPPGAVATYLLTMTVPAGFTGNLSNTVTITPPSTVNDTNAANNTATDVDQAATRLTLTKISQGGTRAFTFTGNNGWASQTLTTITPGVGVTGATQVLASPGVATTITETMPTGFVLSSVTCTGMGAGGTVTPAASSFTLNAAAVAAGSNVACTVTNSVQSQPVFPTCPSTMYLSQGPNANTNTTLYNISTATNPFTYPTIGQGTNVYNGSAFNPLDNYLYAINHGGGTGNRLIRIGADGSTVDLGPVAGMATADWISGTFSDTGVMYVLAGGGSTNLRAIDVQNNTSTLITLSSSVQASDIAWIGGLIYTVQAGGQLRSINPVTGAVTNIGSPSGTADYGAMFGSPTGLFGNANGGGFYSFDLTTGARTLISSSPGATVNDGASCPTAPITFNADLSVTKTNTPASGPSDLPGDTYVTGQARTYTIVVTNNGPFGAQNIVVNDPVPAGIAAATMSWTCASTSGGAACGSANGTGALNDTGLDLPAGAVATYLVTMTVPAGFTGDLTNTVTITPPITVNDSNAANNTATDVDQPAPQLTIRKISVGGVGSFGFTGNNGWVAQTLTTTIAGTPVSGAVQALTTTGTTTTITEGTIPATYRLTDITCTGLGAGGTATPDLANRTITLDAAATASGASITCTFTNTLTQPALSINKAGNGPWTIGQTGATYTLSVNNTGNAATSGTITVRDQLPAGIGIRPASGFTAATGWTCTYSDEAAQNNSIITPNTGMLVTCTSTNVIAAGATVPLTLPVLVTSTAPPSVTNYASIGGGGDPFNGGSAPVAGAACTDTAHCANATTSVTASPPAPASCPIGAAVNLFSPAPFQATLNADNTTQTLTATLLPTASTYTVGTGSGGRFVVDMNWRWSAGIGLPSSASTLTLRVNGTDYATLTTQAGFPGFGTLVASNGASLFGGTTTMETNRISTENIWVTLPVSVTSITSVQMLYVSGSISDDFIFTGPALYGCASSADLSITKTNGVTQYVPGETLSYTIVASNAGPDSAANAVFADPAVGGLTVSSVTCGSAAGGAACPSVANTTVALMQGAGIVIPTLPAGGSLTFTVTATVNAGTTGPLVNTATITPPGNINDPTAANNTAVDTDQPASRVTIRKISVGGVGSFGFTGTNGVPAQTLTTTTAGTPVSGAVQALTAAGTVTTITESTSPATYRATDITCTGLGAGGTATPDLVNRTITLDAAATAAGANIVCTFTNTLQQADIQVVKTASPTSVLTGGVVTYTIVVSNAGPVAVTNAVLTDVPASGQTCTVPTTTASCTATGGASCPAATVPVADLLAAGVTIPSLPVGGQVTVVLQCTVSATGLP